MNTAGASRAGGSRTAGWSYEASSAFTSRPARRDYPCTSQRSSSRATSTRRHAQPLPLCPRPTASLPHHARERKRTIRPQPQPQPTINGRDRRRYPHFRIRGQKRASADRQSTRSELVRCERVDAVDLDARIYAKAVVTAALQEFPAPCATCEFKTESRCVPRGEADAPTSVFRLFGSGMTLRGFGSPAPPMGFVGRWPVGLGRREACDDLLLVEERVFARLVER
jgi:hypothetical protein